jgi:hypothetical protein
VKVYGGYDLFVTAISCDKDQVKAGDAVTFTATVVNAGDRDIPAGTTIGVQFQVDGSTNVYTWCDSYNGGLKAGEKVNLTANGGIGGNKWNAVAGNHTITAWVDDVNRLPAEVNENNNRTNATIQVQEAQTNPGTGNNDPVEDPGYTKVYGGYDLFVTNVKYDKNNLRAGDAVTFTATVVNAGDRDIPAGTIIGAQFQVDGSYEVITWSDSYSGGLKPDSQLTSPQTEVPMVIVGTL